MPCNEGGDHIRPSQGSPLPQKAKTPAKAGVHLSTTTSTLPGLDRIPAFLDLLKQALHFFQRPRGVIQRHARQLAGHVVVEAVQVLGYLAAQFLVQRSLQRTNDTDGAAHRRPPALRVPGLLCVPCQFQTLDGAIEQQLHRPVLGHFLGQVDLLVGIDRVFHLIILFTTPGRLSSWAVRNELVLLICDTSASMALNWANRRDSSLVRRIASVSRCSSTPDRVFCNALVRFSRIPPVWV